MKVFGYLALLVALGIFFGDANGVFGSVTQYLDPTLRSKIINSLAIFGLVCIGFAIWMYEAKDRPASSVPGPMVLALWLSLSYGFVTLNCEVFAHCDRPNQTGGAECTTEYDRQGARSECR